MGYNKDELKSQIDAILLEVVGGSDWSDTDAGNWAKEAQNRIAGLLKKDGYKIAILTEAVAKGSGCVKVHYCLLAEGDLQINTQVTSPTGITFYCLAVCTKY
eukprot:TRINITY_DN9420_c2_g1_i2.p1 TRINITY_DN9420_c2_g1~~TRINITY_DN9420_c2_g1_i2.p1  ORF type:complete len:120 (+),score=25.76 TRINITY_DN9420_c2_g1_i2:55-360(+)